MSSEGWEKGNDDAVVKEETGNCYGSTKGHPAFRCSTTERQHFGLENKRIRQPFPMPITHVMATVESLLPSFVMPEDQDRGEGEGRKLPPTARTPVQ
jgi:hypothetical protein